MSAQDNGGPAFPIIHPPVEGVTNGGVESYGLTLRDYLAAKALSGLLADPTPFEDRGKGIKAAYATTAYEYADAMLEARQK